MGASLEIMTADYLPLLSHGMSCTVTARNSGPGSITITYPVDGTHAEQLSANLIVRARASNGVDGPSHRSTELAPYVLQDFRTDLVQVGDRKIRMGVWQGVQHGWYKLQRALCHSNSFLGTPTTRLNGNAGSIMYFKILLDARARNVLTELSITGDHTHDATSEDSEWLNETFAPDLSPWSRTADEILAQISGGDRDADFICEWDFWSTPTLGDDETDPEIITWLRLYNPGAMGVDRTSVSGDDVPLTIKSGPGVKSAPKNESVGEGPLQRMLAYNKDGDYVIVETDDIPASNVHEGALYVADADLTELDRRGTRELTRRRKIYTEQSVELDLSGDSGLPVPGHDAQVGDYLYLDLTGGERDRRRLAEWSLTLDPKGNVTAGLIMDEVIRTYRQRQTSRQNEIDRQIELLGFGAYL